MKFSPSRQTDQKSVCGSVVTLGTGCPEIHLEHRYIVIFSISNTFKTYLRSVAFLQLKVLTQVDLQAVTSILQVF